VDLRFPRFCKERFTTSRGNTHIVETLATPEWEVNLQMSGVPLNLQRYLSWTCFRSPRHRPISQIDYGACNLLIVLAQHRPARQPNHNQNTRREREDHSRPALAILRLKFQEIAVARTASGQMVQIGLGLRQRHPVPRNRRDYLA